MTTRLLAALAALTDWGVTHTSPTDENSPHALLIEAREAIEEAKSDPLLNAAPELLAALGDMLDLAEAEIESLLELGRDDPDTNIEAGEALGRFKKARAVYYTAKGEPVPGEDVP